MYFEYIKLELYAIKKKDSFCVREFAAGKKYFHYRKRTYSQFDIYTFFFILALN